MTIDDKIRDEKLQYGINGEAAKKYQHYHLVKLINMNLLHSKTLRGKCTDKEFLLVRILWYLNWIRRFTKIFQYFLNMEKYGPWKKIRIWTIFTQWKLLIPDQSRTIEQARLHKLRLEVMFLKDLENNVIKNDKNIKDRLSNWEKRFEIWNKYIRIWF